MTGENTQLRRLRPYLASGVVLFGLVLAIVFATTTGDDKPDNKQATSTGDWLHLLSPTPTVTPTPSESINTCTSCGSPSTITSATIPPSPTPTSTPTPVPTPTPSPSPSPPFTQSPHPVPDARVTPVSLRPGEPPVVVGFTDDGLTVAIYTVRPGDNLSEIAYWFSTPVTAVYEWSKTGLGPNPDPNLIFPNQKIVVRVLAGL